MVAAIKFVVTNAERTTLNLKKGLSLKEKKEIRCRIVCVPLARKFVDVFD